MNRRLVAGRGLVAMVAVLLLGGCIRESLPPCPPLVIELSVKDKNYFNIDDAVRLGLLERRAEDLPFRDYVHSLYYIVRDEQGEVVAEQHNTPVTDDSQVQRIVLPASLPYGTYTVTAWGNMQSEEPLGKDATQAEMEAAGAAANDIYLASATLEYRYGRDLFSVGMERTKGNLLIKAENLPDNIDFSTKNIEDIFALVDRHFTYSGLTAVHTERDWMVPNEILTQTLMCPSPVYEGSKLSVAFIDKSAVTQTAAGQRVTYYPTLVPQDVHITMGRNEITILRYAYVAEGDSEGEFRIYVRVNGNWELIHDMEIE